LEVNLEQGPSHELGESIWVDSGQYTDKICYYCSFKTRLEGQLEQGPCHRLGEVNVWIKMIIIIVFKPDSGADPRQGSGHGSGGLPQLTQNF
jgi:hypothetical protein